MRMFRILMFLCTLLLAAPALHAQDFLQKAKDYLDAGECDKAKVAYEAYKVENPQGNAEVASLIEMCVKCPSFLYDYDNNEYRVVHIGKQCWMAENLRTTHYDNGKNISLSRELSDTKAYYYYAEGRSVTKESYGLLYNWRAVMGDNYSPSSNLSRVQGVCPKGWHVPNDSQTRWYHYCAHAAGFQVCGSQMVCAGVVGMVVAGHCHGASQAAFRFHARVVGHVADGVVCAGDVCDTEPSH